MQVKWIRSVLCALPNYACLMRESEWCCSLLVSAMYAGLFVTHNEGHFFRCEGRPCTAPLPIWFVFGLLVFKLIVICESIWICDFCNRKELGLTELLANLVVSKKIEGLLFVHSKVLGI